MLNAAFFIIATGIWGSTWLAIKLQLSQVSPVFSVGYRFILAAVVLLLFCTLRKKSLRFSLADHLSFLALGAALFSFNYILTYWGTGYLTSGLVAIVFSTILLFNILNLRVFMKKPVQPTALIGGVIGLTGICLLFWHDLVGFGADKDSLIGLGLCLVASYLSSLGNVISVRNSGKGLPVSQSNGFAMAYGGAITMIFGFILGEPLTMDWSLGYLGPLVYLAVFGSVVAFGCYLTLAARIGAEFAAYATLANPMIALLLSTWFEGYLWTPNASVGVAAILIGNFIILTPRDKLKRLAHVFPWLRPLPGPHR